jgi:hypothetical protein
VHNINLIKSHTADEIYVVQMGMRSMLYEIYEYSRSMESDTPSLSFTALERGLLIVRNRMPVSLRGGESELGNLKP